MLLEGSNASTVLTWVRPDLDKHLEQIRAQLEHLASSQHIGDGIENIAAHLDTLKYTFEALVLQGATLVVEEMIAVCAALESPDVRDRQKTFGTLMDAIVVLPSYLDRLQAGHHDLPILLLPVINELRTAYNANIVSEATLFSPSLDVHVPELEHEADEHVAVSDEPFQVFARRMRRQWETALLRWLQHHEDLNLLSPLLSVCEALQRRSQRMDLRRLWWIAGEIIGGLLDGVTDNDVNLRRLFARLNLTLKTLTQGGEEATDTQSVDAISQALLFHIAQARPGSKAVDKLRERFHLQELVPDRDALIRARGAVTGRNRELYTSLGAAVRDELALVKDALDLELRTGEIPEDSRDQIHDALLRLKDTLKMMGLGDSAQSIGNLMPTFDAGEKADLDEQNRESLLMDLAGKLIQVESVLEEQITTLGEPVVEDHEPSYIELPRHEQRRIRAHLLNETVNSLHQVQDGVRRHFSGEEAADYTSPLEHISGAMELIGESETASLAIKLRNALGNLLRGNRSEAALDPVKLETVADAVAAFELYLAGCRDQQSNRERFLKVLKDRLDNLPTGEMEVIETFEQEPVSAAKESDISRPAETTDAGLLPPSIDPELLAVFLEEFEAVVAALGEQLPNWLQRQEDMSLMTDIRRGFHTLKGSGRMVGADEIGDFAWHIEEMLNAMLEGNVESIDDVSVIVVLSEAMLPAMKSRLLQEPSELTVTAIEATSLQANKVAEGGRAKWTGLSNTLPSFLTTLLPGSVTGTAEPVNEFSAVTKEHAAIDPIHKGLADNLVLLKGLMDKISKDRDNTASDEEVTALHTLAEVTSERPLGREPEIAMLLQAFLETQRKSKKAFTDDAVWAVASSLAYFETCLALHDGDAEAELAEDEDHHIEQLKTLTFEFDVPGQSQPEARKEPEATEITADEVSLATTKQDTGVEDDGASDEDLLIETEAEPIDRELLEIFLEEASDILERCDSLLNTWRDNLPDLDIVRNIQREFHTFKGGARMAGVSALGDLSHAMETLMERVAGHLLPPTVSAIELLEQGCDNLNTWTEMASQGRMPQLGETLTLFEQQVEALSAGTTIPVEPAESEAVPVDSAIEVTEAADALPADSAVEEAETADVVPVDSVVEVTEAADVVPADSVVEVTEAADVVSADSAVEVTEAVDVVPADSAAEETKTVDSVSLESTPDEAAPIKIKPVEPMPVETKPEELQEIPDIVVPPSAPVVSEEHKEEPAGSQHIRVNADLLDSLVNSAGEISIFRSRLEQEVGYMRENLKEFDQTVSRLRGQFRKLEIETETQIRSRYQPEVPDGMDEFDPLEMDRFSSLQHLSRSLSESVSDLLNLQESLETAARKSEALLTLQSRVSTELQEGLMQTRMVHFGNIAPRLRRITRIASKETGKKARLTLRMTGGGDQLDRNVLERITAPLEHLLRNSIVHGIEKPDVRRKLKKPKEGQLSITVSSEATEFVVRVEDDGAGMNLKAIHKRAIAMGLVDKKAVPPPQQLLQFILHSGFSTSKTVTALAGRGVGMDVVNSEIKQIGGSVEIDSEEGQGSCLTIRIPFSLAVMQAIGVMAGEHRYLIPLASVSGVARMLPADFQGLLENEKPVYEYAGESYSILELEPLLGEPSTPLGDDTISILMIKVGELRAAFPVPELLGHKEIIVKPVGPQISSVPGILGGTITGDGQVVIIIDAGPLIRQALMSGASPAPPIENFDIQTQKPLALVVDDSITMRKVTTRVLESNEFEVITARDGVDATEQMQERVPDLLVLDVEMPRMDGYQVAEYVRADTRLRHIPIVMVTSRAGAKHRARGKQAGANAYLSKPYKESELLSEVHKLLHADET